MQGRSVQAIKKREKISLQAIDIVGYSAGVGFGLKA
jgi:hypothetical protein